MPVYGSLYDAYEKVRDNPRLKDIPPERHLFGALGDLPVAAAPRILWTPTTDRYTAPLLSATPAIIDGRRVEVEAIWTRRAGADVEIVVPVGPQGYRALDDLIRRFHLALRDAFDCTGNYAVGTGRTVDRAKVSVNTVVYVQPVEIFLPIYDLHAAQLWEETAVGMKRDA